MFNKILLGIGGFVLALGLLSIAGSSMIQSPNVYETPKNIFDGFFLVPFLITLPLFLIKYSTDRLRTLNIHIKSSWIFIFSCICLVVVLFSAFYTTYNYFVTTNETIEKEYASIDIAYQKRFNLIPNIAKTAKAYGDLELSVVQEISDARKAYNGAATVDEKVRAANQFDSSMRGFILNVENYPTLKSDALYNQIIETLTRSEEEIAEAKKFYNNDVSLFNQSAKVFPTVIIARMAGYNEKEYLKADLGKEIYDSKTLLDSLKK